MNGLGKYKRTLKFLNNLEENSRIDIKDLKQIEELKAKLKHTGYKLRTLELTRIVFFIFLYSSVVSAFTSFIPGSEIVTGKLIKLGSILGTTISLVIVGVASKAISTYMLDLNMVTSTLISIYTKHTKHVRRSTIRTAHSLFPK